MGHLDIDTALAWRGRTVRDSDGEKLGTFGDVFLDRETDRPAFGGVKTGLFGHKESYFPLEYVEDDGEGDLRVPWHRDVVKEAPRIDPDVSLTADEEAALYAHYGQTYAEVGAEPTETPATHPDHEGHEHREGESRLGDDAMTRSEEEVRVGEGPMRATERVRLRKVLVTEHQKQVVPVRKEVIQLETEPAPEGQIESVEEIDRRDV